MQHQLLLLLLPAIAFLLLLLLLLSLGRPAEVAADTTNCLTVGRTTNSLHTPCPFLLLLLLPALGPVSPLPASAAAR
jgi:hypothetical protein